MAFWGSSHSKKDQRIKDPKRKFRFYVQFTGFADVGLSEGDGAKTGEIWFAKTADKPSFTIQTAEHKYLNHTFYYPGSVQWNEISMTMVDPQDPDVAGTLAKLVEKMGYETPTGLDRRSTMSKWSASSNIGDVIVTQLDAEGEPLETWTLWNGFITEVTFGNLEYGSDDLTELTLKFRYDWAQLTLPGNGSTEEIIFD